MKTTAHSYPWSCTRIRCSHCCGRIRGCTSCSTSLRGVSIRSHLPLRALTLIYRTPPNSWDFHLGIYFLWNASPTYYQIPRRLSCGIISRSSLILRPLHPMQATLQPRMLGPPKMTFRRTFSCCPVLAHLELLIHLRLVLVESSRTSESGLAGVLFIALGQARTEMEQGRLLERNP